MMRAAKSMLVLSVALVFAACNHYRSAAYRVVCVGRDGSSIQSSTRDYWWLESRSGVYGSGVSTVFQPRPGDECHVLEVR